MPNFSFTSPEGKSYDVQGPDGATKEQAFQILQSQLKGSSAGAGAQKATPLTDEKGFPTQAAIDQIPGGSEPQTGAGDVNNESLGTKAKGVLEAGRGLVQNSVVGTIAGLREGSGRDPNAVKAADQIESKYGYTPTTKTGQDILGKIGDVVSKSGIQALGPMAGLATDVSEALQGTKNAAQVVSSRFASKGINIHPDIPDSVHAQNVSEARQAGYVLPPSQAKPSLIGSTLEGISGKIKTAQGASLKNEAVTDNLVRKGLGLSPDAPLNEATIDAVQQQAAEPYAAISALDKPFKATEQYNQAIDDLGSKITGLAQKYPGVFSSKEIQNVKDSLKVGDMQPKDAVELTKALRQKARDHLGPMASGSEKDLGHAYKDASNAIEDMVEANLKETGQSKLLENFRHGRELYAKAAEVRRALTPNGHVDAKKLAARLKQGKPLTGELKTAAKFAGAFPKAAQTSERVGSHTPISALDFLAAVGSGSLKAAGLVAGRPLIRAAILSKPGQRMLLGPKALKGMSKNDIIQAVNASVREKNGLPPQEPPRTPPQGPTGPGPTNPPPTPQTPPVAVPSGPKMGVEDFPEDLKALAEKAKNWTSPMGIEDFPDDLKSLSEASKTPTKEPEFYYHGAPESGKTEFTGLDAQASRPNAEKQFSGPGGHATENLQAAEVHAGKGGTVYRVPRLTNPFDARTTGRTTWENLVKALGSKAAANKALQAQGYDGIVFQANNGVGKTELHFNKTPLTPHNVRTTTPFEQSTPKSLSVEPKASGKYDKYPKEVQDKLKAIDDHTKEMTAFFSRHPDKEMAAKNIKGAAMKASAEKRKITGELTETEKRANEKYEKSNYQGKKVTAKGRSGVVKNMAFGKVRIVFPDGSVESFAPEDIKPR